MNRSKEWILSDLYRNSIENYTLKTKIKLSLFYPTIRYMILFRKIQFCNNKFRRFFLRYKLKKLSLKTHIQIPVGTKIDKGFYIGHLGRIIINPETNIGKNMNITTGVVIGRVNTGKKEGCPTIGNEVWIGANSVIVGKIKIGNNVLIAPNAYVNFDVPDNSIVIGNPGVIHYKDNPTKGYIGKKV